MHKKMTPAPGEAKGSEGPQDHNGHDSARATGFVPPPALLQSTGTSEKNEPLREKVGDSFHRFSEAAGRSIRIKNAGHTPAARKILDVQSAQGQDPGRLDKPRLELLRQVPAGPQSSRPQVRLHN